MKSVTNVTGVTYINVAGGASSPATATPSEEEMISCGNPLIGSRKGCGSLELSRGAEGTGSPLHHPFPDSAEILRISGRGICKEAIFSPGASPSEKISTRVRRAGRRPRLDVEWVHTLSSSPGEWNACLNPIKPAVLRAFAHGGQAVGGKAEVEVGLEA